MDARKRTPKTRYWIGRAAQVLAAACGALAGLLGARFLFRLLLANPANPVTGVVATVTRPFLFPWDRFWPPGTLPTVTAERATLVALVFYVALGLTLAVLGQAGRQEKEIAE